LVLGNFTLIGLASWHWIFLINLPIGIAALLVGMKYLPIMERQKTPALDIFGMILAPIAFSMLAFGMSEGGTDWTSPRTLTGLIVGGVALILFIFVELRQKQPLLELRVFGSSDFTRGVILIWISQIALIGSILMVPLFLQNLLGYTPLQSGLTTLPMALGSVVFMPIGGKLFDKVGARPLAFVGLIIITIALYLLSHISLESSKVEIMLPLALMGAGMGLSMMALNTHVLNSAPLRLVSRVTPPECGRGREPVRRGAAFTITRFFFVQIQQRHTPFAGSRGFFRFSFNIITLFGGLLLFTD